MIAVCLSACEVVVGAQGGGKIDFQPGVKDMQWNPLYTVTDNNMTFMGGRKAYLGWRRPAGRQRLRVQSTDFLAYGAQRHPRGGWYGPKRYLEGVHQKVGCP